MPQKKKDGNDNVIGINNEFMQTYINIADNINNCTIYTYIMESYYGRNVIGETVNKYLNDEISKEKFIRQLTTATQIYMME